MNIAYDQAFLIPHRRIPRPIFVIASAYIFDDYESDKGEASLVITNPSSGVVQIKYNGQTYLKPCFLTASMSRRSSLSSHEPFELCADSAYTHLFLHSLLFLVATSAATVCQLMGFSSPVVGAHQHGANDQISWTVNQHVSNDAFGKRSLCGRLKE